MRVRTCEAHRCFRPPLGDEMTKGSLSDADGSSGQDTETFELLSTLQKEALRGGRPLIRRDGSRVSYLEPFALAFSTRPGFWEQLLQRVSLFALALCAIVTLLVLLGAAPWPIALTVLVWLVLAVAARLHRAARKREVGEYLVDFERELLVRLSPPMRVVRFGNFVLHRQADVLDSSCEWLFATESGASRSAWMLSMLERRPRPLRLACGTSHELEPVLFLFRRYGIRVEATATDET